MKVLEELELIVQPHTSAGRTPTDKGYRFFINKLMRHLELRDEEQQRLKNELQRLQKQYLELGQSLSRLLSQQTRGAAFALLPDSTSSSGLSQVIDEETEPEDIKQVARFMEELEEKGQKLLTKDIKGVTTYIGEESPVSISPNYSLVVTRIRLPGNKKGVIGIVGPKRMSYARNISLLEYVRKLLASGLGVLFIFLNF
jgi:transcriptional regulator of heat shock response